MGQLTYSDLQILHKWRTFLIQNHISVKWKKYVIGNSNLKKNGFISIGRLLLERAENSMELKSYYYKHCDDNNRMFYFLRHSDTTFTWHKTKEGFSFWFHVHRLFRESIKKND